MTAWLWMLPSSSVQDPLVREPLHCVFRNSNPVLGLMRQLPECVPEISAGRCSAPPLATLSVWLRSLHPLVMGRKSIPESTRSFNGWKLSFAPIPGSPYLTFVRSSRRRCLLRPIPKLYLDLASAHFRVSSTSLL